MVIFHKIHKMALIVAKSSTRSQSENSFEVEKVHNTGITVLYEPKKPQEPFVESVQQQESKYTITLIIDFSIVFVHGLQGHPRNTWTWESDRAPPSTSTPIEREPQSKRIKLSFKLSSDQSKNSDDLSKPQSTIFWPYHFLHEKCPESRILTWGYNSIISTFFHGPTNKNNVFSYSRDLLGDLIRERRVCK